MCGYIETCFLENDKTSFDQFFRRWLIDNNGSDDVHLTIEFAGFELKCDLIDVLLNPFNIPNAKNLVLETDLNFHLPPTKSRQTKPLVSVCSMKPSAFVELSGICESVLYGMPRVVKATSCWKVEWEELEKNQASFKWLNSIMTDKGQALILETKEIGPIHSTFLMLPSGQSGTMLIKSIAVGDLMMPSSVIQCSTEEEQTINEEMKEKVSRAVEEIRVLADYNPFDYTSNLFKASLTQTSNSINNSNHNKKKVKQQHQQQPESDDSFCSLRTTNPGGTSVNSNFTSAFPRDSLQPETKNTSAWRVHDPRMEHQAPCERNPNSTNFSSKRKKPRFEPPRFCK